MSPPNSAGVSGPPSKKAYLKIGTIPPFNANKLRKSPSVGVTKVTEPNEKSKTAPNSAEDGENKSIEQAQEATSQETSMTDEQSKTNN